jgi:hypothetical protein
MILHILSLSTSPLLCTLLALAVTQTSSANRLLTNKRSVVLHASRTVVTYPCPPSACSMSRSCPTRVESDVTLRSEATGLHRQATYTYTVTGGRVAGEGSEVTWDLTGVSPGLYVATVEVRDNSKNRAVSSVTVKVGVCLDCLFDCEWGCPTITVTCYDKVKAGTPITCRVDVGLYPPPSVSRFKWSAKSSNGEDLSEGISSNGRYASIPTNGLAGQAVYTRVDLEGLDRSCASAASSSTRVKP